MYMYLSIRECKGEYYSICELCVLDSSKKNYVRKSTYGSKVQLR